uniref:Uncharacterized protein n=1 Tax=Oryza sativa subsp. japonica TaxID=39947 RepID=Q6YSJ3_ORYSJ|nr:hypothetical protein [Oryza sativa Japonica Group]BAD32048.1 hypothetical protein [Oryza sativa Japonica Group]
MERREKELGELYGMEGKRGDLAGRFTEDKGEEDMASVEWRRRHGADFCSGLGEDGGACTWQLL